MEKQQTEVFKSFIRTKQMAVSDFLSLLEKCADRLAFLEESFLYLGEEDDFNLNERTVKGLAGIVGDVESDLRLLVADMMTAVDKHVAEFKKRRAEEEKKGAKANQVNA